MKCKECRGCGKVQNPRYDRAGTVAAFERGIPSMKTCPNCKGYGFTGLDRERIENILKYILNHGKGLFYKDAITEIEYILTQISEYEPKAEGKK